MRQNSLALLAVTSVVAIAALTLVVAQTAPPAGQAPPPAYVSQYSGIQFALIPPGKFVMGSENSEPDELPVHEENITQPFYMSIWEITQEQWNKVMGNKMPERSQHREKGKPRLPVENVSIGKARAFCEELSKIEGRKCRLPTEAEWEYVCRAGTTTLYSAGNSPTELAEVAWFTENSGGQTHEAGLRKPNAWGIFDMHGNVWEYCDTYYFDRYDMKRNNSMRMVVRGGCFDSRSDECRSANRWTQSNTAQRKDVGFRIVLEVK